MPLLLALVQVQALAQAAALVQVREPEQVWAQQLVQQLVRVLAQAVVRVQKPPLVR